MLDGKAYAIGPDGQSQALPSTVPSAGSGTGSDEVAQSTLVPRTVEPPALGTEPGGLLTPATQTATGQTAAPATATGNLSLAFTPCAGGLVVVGMAAGLPLWGRLRSEHR